MAPTNAPGAGGEPEQSGKQIAWGILAFVVGISVLLYLVKMLVS
ncbi:MAG: hypothetical protein WBD36_07875 [Bacteroidota bacterium]